MDRDSNYVAVGAFVLLVVAMGVSFVFWYTDLQDKRTYERYEIYFPGSVSGLTAGSPVRYLGVDVGKVWRIALDPQQRKTVQVIADIDSSAPIDDRTRASLSLQGVTGLLFVDLEQDPKAESAGALQQGQRYPIIRSRRSDFDVLLSNLPELTTHLVELATHFNDVFSDENVRALKATLQNAKLASDHLPATLQEVQQLVADVRRTTQEVQATVADLRVVITDDSPDLRAAFANIKQITDNLAKTTTRLNSFVAENEPGFSRFSKQSLPEFEQLLRESRQAARDFRDLSRSLKQNPSQLIYESTYRGIEVPK
ncbi:MAG TPA: MlaD family protein [Steroidobacteraceae bacterium]|jgi:phospholipid/cholesterol/gamma-HCH transport system substrate-binding protein|nr:MlaD family protein [Steroidobacteraceae bacterium]